MPIGTALLTSALSSGAGILANEALNPDTPVPDFSAEARAEFARRRQDLNETLQRRREDVEADLAAAGRTGSAGTATRGQIYSESAGAQADLAARMADAISRAEQREERMQFEQDRAEEQARAQGISNLFGRGGQMLAMSQVGDPEGGTDTATESLSNRFGFEPEAIAERQTPDLDGGGSGGLDPSQYTAGDIAGRASRGYNPFSP